MNKSSLLKQLFKSTFITMFCVEFSNTVSCVVDGLVTSRFLGGDQMAAYGIAAPYFSIAAIISGILMVGGQTMCAKAIGSGDKKAADKAFSTVCIVGTSLSVILAIIGVIFSDQIAMLFGAKGEYASLMSYTSLYLKGLFVGTPFFVMLAVLAPIVQLDGGGKRANMASLVVTVVDILTDLIGVLVFKGGLLVIAIATSFSYFAALAVLLTHFLKKGAGFKLKFNSWDKSIASDLVKTGLPRGVSMLCRALGPILTNMIVLSVAATAGMTAMSVQSNVKFILGAPACGISGAVLLLASLYVGCKDKVLLKDTMVTAIKYTVVIICSIAVLTFAFAGPIANFYLPDSTEVATEAISAIRWYATSLPFMSINLCLACFLQATGKTVGSYLMNVGNELVCIVTCAFGLSRPFGIKGVWAAFPAGQLLLLGMYAIGSLISSKKIPGISKIDRLLNIGKDTFVPDENRLYAAVETVEDVVALSVATDKFCKDRGIDKKRCFLAALFVEELTDNVIEHGFNDGKKHLLETIVTIDSEEVILHIRDDCRKFNLKEKAADWKLDPQHPEKNVGIRMVLGMAKDVSYTSAMNTNNIIVRI